MFKRALSNHHVCKAHTWLLSWKYQLCSPVDHVFGAQQLEPATLHTNCTYSVSFLCCKGSLFYPGQVGLQQYCCMSAKANYILRLLLKGKSQQRSSGDASLGGGAVWDSWPTDLLNKSPRGGIAARWLEPSTFSTWVLWKVFSLTAMFFFSIFYFWSRSNQNPKFSLLHLAPSATLLARSASASCQRPILEILFCSRICNLQHLHSDHTPFFPPPHSFFPP